MGGGQLLWVTSHASNVFLRPARDSFCLMNVQDNRDSRPILYLTTFFFFFNSPWKLTSAVDWKNSALLACACIFMLSVDGCQHFLLPRLYAVNSSVAEWYFGLDLKSSNFKSRNVRVCELHNMPCRISASQLKWNSFYFLYSKLKLYSVPSHSHFALKPVMHYFGEPIPNPDYLWQFFYIGYIFFEMTITMIVTYLQIFTNHWRAWCQSPRNSGDPL